MKWAYPKYLLYFFSLTAITLVCFSTQEKRKSQKKKIIGLATSKLKVKWGSLLFFFFIKKLALGILLEQHNKGSWQLPPGEKQTEWLTLAFFGPAAAGRNTQTWENEQQGWLKLWKLIFVSNVARGASLSVHTLECVCEDVFREDRMTGRDRGRACKPPPRVWTAPSMCRGLKIVKEDKRGSRWEPASSLSWPSMALN